jgi:hypothetical protein
MTMHQMNDRGVDRNYQTSHSKMFRAASNLVCATRRRLVNAAIFSRAFTAAAPSLANLNVRPDGVAVIELNR